MYILEMFTAGVLAFGVASAFVFAFCLNYEIMLLLTLTDYVNYAIPKLAVYALLWVIYVIFDILFIPTGAKWEYRTTISVYLILGSTLVYVAAFALIVADYFSGVIALWALVGAIVALVPAYFSFMKSWEAHLKTETWKIKHPNTGSIDEHSISEVQEVELTDEDKTATIMMHVGLVAMIGLVDGYVTQKWFVAESKSEYDIQFVSAGQNEHHRADHVLLLERGILALNGPKATIFTYDQTINVGRTPITE